MTKKIIYLPLIILNTCLFSQIKFEGFPAKELILFKISNNNSNQFIKMGTNKSEILALLGEPNNIYESAFY